MLKCGKLTQEEIASIVNLPLEDIRILAEKTGKKSKKEL